MLKPIFLFLSVAACILFMTGAVGATTLDVYDWNQATDSGVLVGQIDTIATAQTGAQHYAFTSASGHPSGVNLGVLYSSFWVHENTNNGEFSFSFIFSMDESNTTYWNDTELWFRIVDSVTDPTVTVSDDPGEAVEEGGENWFHGDYSYIDNSDGIVVSGITGNDWTIMIEAVDFGAITDWFAASGETADFSDDLTLTLGHQYRIVLEGYDPSDEPVSPVPEPATMLLLGSGLMGLAGLRKKRANRRKSL